MLKTLEPCEAMMKKLLCGILAALMLLSAVACTGGDTTETEGDTTVALPETDAPTEAPTAAPTEPVTEAPTADTTTETLTEPVKGGCGSAVTFGLAGILVAAAAVVIRRKD